MPSLPIAALPAGDAGRLLTRLHRDHRGGCQRYGIAELTNDDNGRTVLVLLLGHEDATHIYMPYDIRTRVGVAKGATLNFTVRPVGVLGRLRWYLKSPDPAVYLPAWMSMIGLALGVLGILLGIAPLVMR